ncbi:hypothetical protein [Pontibaca salina]|uniref:Uncharacterized protein n=1 Tax=Pontibaca salina TaxID=2795731 RepID=A0A934HHP5_9RHOB|nr:hypothetical protein [Pontibaca salina]MBI6628354.1 hypothetical protein [Pontibaca salina]
MNDVHHDWRDQWIIDEVARAAENDRRIASIQRARRIAWIGPALIILAAPIGLLLCILFYTLI